ncbi:MAG: hypothetical protein OFPII_03280 [Osedax symbiont Rs1]|nr:MAG: hypothetical protein OFPII_03280 [Osedax symbiont Rs1]
MFIQSGVCGKASVGLFNIGAARLSMKTIKGSQGCLLFVSDKLNLLLREGVAQ